MSESPNESQILRPPKRKRRVYQACEPCRIRKAKCDRGSDDDPRPPPCARCMRESIQSHCILSSKRTRRHVEQLDAVRGQQIARDTALLDPSTSRPKNATRNEPARYENDTTTPPPTSMPPEDDTGRASAVVTLAPETFGIGLASASPQSSRISESTSQGQVPGSSNVGQPPHHPGRQGANTAFEQQQHLQTQSDLIQQGNFRPYYSDSQRNLTDSVIHTLVSKPNDALSLLFEAAGRQDPTTLNSRRESLDQTQENIGDSHAQANDPSSAGHGGPPRSTHPTPHSINTASNFSLSNPAVEIIKLWERYRFVRQSWLTAREAIQAVDLFFRNLSPLSPILLDYYSDHANHGTLISDEPMLCTTILTISSRYHILSEDGGMLRSDDIHRKFSLYWKTLFMRVMYAQDTEANAKTRNLGTIESFILMTEWHSRDLHFPPDDDGWGAEMPVSGQSGEDESQHIHDHKRSTEEVEGAARRSDRMSWMLLGAALTLAHELGVSEQRLLDREIPSQLYSTDDERRHVEFLELRRSRPRRLLYIYINQLASRLGWSSLIPRIISDSAEQPFGSETEKQWHNVMSRWISLTRLMKTATDMLFSSVITEQLLRSGKYVTSLEHFGQLLQDWLADYLTVKAKKKFLDILFIEFQFTRTYINSLAVQAVAERAFKAGHPSSGPTECLMTFVFESHSVDFGFIQEVVDGSRKIIKKVLELSDEGILKFCPVRTFSRIISASILLLKATGLGARVEEARYSLELLDNLIKALRHDPVDELHLANQYASLLRTYVNAFRTRFLRVVRSRDNFGREQRPDSDHFGSRVEQEQEVENYVTLQNNVAVSNAREHEVGGTGNFDGNDMTDWTDATTYDSFRDDWMCLPLDAFDTGFLGFGNGVGANGLDFFHTA